MIQKNEFPILEYDFDSTEILKPNHGAEQLTLPEKCVFAFLGDTIDSYAAETGAAVAERFETITKTYPIYVVKNDGEEFCLCQAPLGAPAAAQFMDCLIACGCRKIVTAGSCGVLTEMAENEFLIPTKALRDEGTSYHYLPAARYAEPASEAVQAIEKTFRALGLPFRECITWTTDGFFRETRDMVAYRKAEGCATVEMECAALAAGVSKIRQFALRSCIRAIMQRIFSPPESTLTFFKTSSPEKSIRPRNPFIYTSFPSPYCPNQSTRLRSVLKKSVLSNGK